MRPSSPKVLLTRLRLLPRQQRNDLTLHSLSLAAIPLVWRVLHRLRHNRNRLLPAHLYRLIGNARFSSAGTEMYLFCLNVPFCPGRQKCEN